MAGDVLSGKVFGTGGSGKATGTMVSRPAVTNAVRLTEDAQGSPIWAASNGTLAMGIPLGAYVTPYTDSAAAVLQTTYAQAAAAIGLTAGKLVAGNTVLGVTGTYAPTRTYVVGGFALARPGNVGASGSGNGYAWEWQSYRVRFIAPTGGKLYYAFYSGQVDGESGSSPFSISCNLGYGAYISSGQYIYCSYGTSGKKASGGGMLWIEY